jgi:ligand-binding SRPBCC domain-containing protein
VSARFENEQWIAAPLERVFAFFADPHNLSRIMPPGQGTRLVKLNLVPPPRIPGESSTVREPMAGAGTELTVSFQVNPCVPIREKWIVRISEFSLNDYFSDEQKQGPFRLWQHTHSFEEKTVEGHPGTLIRAEVEYEVGFGVIGTALERTFFQRMMRSTFTYRKKAVEKIFETFVTVPNE